MIKKTIFIFFAVCLFVACENNTPYELNNAKRPIIIQCINEKGVILSDADGKIYAYHNGYYIAKILQKSGVKNGDIFIQ